jgi:hypothetical protein
VSEQNIESHNDEPYRKVGTGYITFFNWIDDRIGNPVTCLHMKARPMKTRPSDISKLGESGNRDTTRKGNNCVQLPNSAPSCSCWSYANDSGIVSAWKPIKTTAS